MYVQYIHTQLNQQFEPMYIHSVPYRPSKTTRTKTKKKTIYKSKHISDLLC